MKIVKDLPSDGDGQTEKTGENDTFFDSLPRELFAAVCRGMDAFLYPMAFVSEQLMVLRQTRSCRNLLEYEGFYSIEGVLKPDECEMIRQSMRAQTEHTIRVTLFDQQWDMRVVPAGHGALLVFSPDTPHQVGITLAASRLRESAGHLLMQAEELETEGIHDDARFIRREAMRILRQVNHMQLLSGAPEPMNREECTPGQILASAARQLERRGVHAEVVCQPEAEVSFWMDKGMLLSALMTLVSNSLRHGGADVHIALRAERQENSLVFCVDDDGTGLSDEALARMNDTWRQTDATVGSWGLGIPYARRIAELHGGMLVFTQSPGGGCAARIRLPLYPSDGCGLESESGYQTVLAAGVSEAEVELSDVLEPEAYGKD